MPVRKVKGGYKWGKAGKVCPTKSSKEKISNRGHSWS